jgi:hypothetical protein
MERFRPAIEKCIITRHECDNAGMNSDQPLSPRRRLQALLAIPDSQRSEAEWDELVELEISLAPGNRTDGPRQDMTGQPQRQNQGGGGKPRQHNNAPKGGKKAPRKPRGRGPRSNPTT